MATNRSPDKWRGSRAPEELQGASSLKGGQGAPASARIVGRDPLAGSLMTLFTRDSLERMGVTTRSVQSERRPRVKLHRNAKTTPTMRALIVQRIRHEQWPPAEAAAAAGISVRTTYKWLRRHRLGGRPARGRLARPIVSHGARHRHGCRHRRRRHERRTDWAITPRGFR